MQADLHTAYLEMKIQTCNLGNICLSILSCVVSHHTCCIRQVQNLDQFLCGVKYYSYNVMHPIMIIHGHNMALHSYSIKYKFIFEMYTMSYMQSCHNMEL